MTAFDLHKSLINQYLTFYGGTKEDFQRDTSKDKTDLDVIRENHRFLWDDLEADTWEKKLAKKYYDKLFKEYCICDLSRYKDNKVALRWRVKQEVVIGKGQFLCGNKKCNEKEDLRSWEVNFAYNEDRERKNALVKLRLCPNCSTKLNYHSKKREIKRAKSTRKRKSLSHKSISEENSKDDSVLQQCGSNSPQCSSSEAEKADSKQSSSMENPWSKTQTVEEKSREDEIEEYLEMLLL